jgi:hypothetical protein
MLGDYARIGVQAEDGRIDIDRLICVLQLIGAHDYLCEVWDASKTPHAWEDFLLLAPRCQEAGIRLWLYLAPPSEPDPPEPFCLDYVRWAEECGKTAADHPAVRGLCIDDFNDNVSKFTPSYCKQMMEAAHAHAPHLALLVTSYWGYQWTLRPHIAASAIDGVIFPFLGADKLTFDKDPKAYCFTTSNLVPELKAYRAWLDSEAKTAGLSGKLPLILMVYATPHSACSDPPLPPRTTFYSYVRTCLEIGLAMSKKRIADGVVTYGLPKNDLCFDSSVASVYRRTLPWPKKLLSLLLTR